MHKIIQNESRLNPQWQWGYENPAAQSVNFAVFFSWDLHRILEDSFDGATADTLELFIRAAQQNINALLKQYANLDQSCTLFQPDAITLHYATHQDGKAVIELRFSDDLEKLLLNLSDFYPTTLALQHMA